MQRLKKNARITAEKFSIQASAKKSIACFQQILSLPHVTHNYNDESLNQVLALIIAEWEIIKSFIDSGIVALSYDDSQQEIVKGEEHDR